MAAETQTRPTLSFYGTPGLIDMPTASTMRDGDISLSTGYSRKTFRSVATFQITPRLSGVFRYNILQNLDQPTGDSARYDRSFDVKYRFLDETRYRPAMAFGLRDFGGTGVYSSEYLVATKHLRSNLTITGGLGWGRLGSYNNFGNPLGYIHEGFKNRGSTGNNAGALDVGEWFRGDAAFFAGVEWRASDRLTLKAEYSSDAYTRESQNMGFVHRSPINLGATYRFANGVDLAAAYRYGTELGVMLHYTFNPAEPRLPDGLETGGPSVIPRDMAAAASWNVQANDTVTIRDALTTRLDETGIALKGLTITGSTATAHVRNDRFGAGAQVIGRVARAMTGVMPANVETFRIVPLVNDMPVTAVTVTRSDLEELANDLDGSWKSYARADIEDGQPYDLDETAKLPGAYPEFDTRVGPYVLPSFFDPDSPIRADVGIEAGAAFTPAPGFILSGLIRKPLFGNLADSNRLSNSVLPHVRTDSVLYERNADLELTYLTAEYFSRPGPNLYGRVTAGYLERMYGGVSGEVLWKKSDSPLALGVELNYARKRDFDIQFGFQNYEIWTGHASAYYDFGNGFLGQVDVGRYLAGDWGATFAMDREFSNGFKIGAYFTLTDVPFDQFGEGSFDKGIRITIPVSWFSGSPSQGSYSQVIQPVVRDGGARLSVRNRLYDVTRGYHEPELKESWGRFWR